MHTHCSNYVLVFFIFSSVRPRFVLQTVSLMVSGLQYWMNSTRLQYCKVEEVACLYFQKLCSCECQMRDKLLLKALYGKFLALLNSEGIDAGWSTCWLRQYLHSESESTIQDQVIATRLYEGKIMQKAMINRLCRICGQSEEITVCLFSTST